MNAVVKNTFLRYNNICNLMSFHKSGLHKGLWNIRNNIRYIFFFLIKKTSFLKLLFLYKLFYLALNLKKNLLQEINNSYLFLVSKLIKLQVFIINKYYKNYYIYCSDYDMISFYSFKKKYILYNGIYISCSNSFTSKLRNYNFFFFLYKTFSFLIYMWFYSIKFLNWYSFNLSSIPIKTKLFTVLKSPHKDKKSREQFKVLKIKKAMSFPSFIGSNLFLFYFINVSISIQHVIYINK